MGSRSDHTADDMFMLLRNRSINDMDQRDDVRIKLHRTKGLNAQS